MAKEAPKSPAASKTLWIGALAILTGLFNEIGPLAQKYADQEVTRTALVSGIVMIALRLVTKSPLVFPPKN